MFPLLFSVFHPNEVQKKDNASFFSVFGYAICKRTGRIINKKNLFPPNYWHDIPRKSYYQLYNMYTTPFP